MYTNCVELGEKIPCDDENFPFGAVGLHSPGRAHRLGLPDGSWGRQKIEGWAFLVCIVIGSIGLPHFAGRDAGGSDKDVGVGGEWDDEAGC